MSAKGQWIRSHVARLLEDEWNVCRATTDCDGDFPFRSGTAACWVQVLDFDRPLVRVLAHAAVDVKCSAKLLTELNEIQNRATSATVRWNDNAVLVSQTLSPYALNRKTLRQAMASVCRVAEDIGGLLAGMFDGATPFPATATVDEDAR
jgi:hypothetical protein